ncbi:MAG: ATP-binding protein [Pseudomonadota bacterium]
MSLEARLSIVVALIVALCVGFTLAVSHFDVSAFHAGVFSLLVLLPLSLFALRRVMAPINRYLRVLRDGVAGFRDGDFSLSIVANRKDELGELASLYNRIGDVLRRERQELFQRELLLDTVIQSTPWALVLTNAGDAVLYANTAARQLFHEGRKMEGATFATLLGGVPESLREAALSPADGLYTIAGGEEPEVYHVTHRRFTLNTREHHLHLFKRLTRELNRQELESWKKVIRVISHELNNSLAPIASMAHSGRLMFERGDTSRLPLVFDTIDDRTLRLKGFLDDYARFAKLPRPRLEDVQWQPFVAGLRGMVVFALSEPLPARCARIDPAQLQQVLINLIKNAHEAGGSPEAVTLSVREQGAAFVLRVEDRGPGMSEAVLANALLPFYSTKTEGTGLGLTLCREIVEAHEGRLVLANREGGGLEVRIVLPA